MKRYRNSNTSAADALHLSCQLTGDVEAHFVTATMKMLLMRTWKNDVDPSVMMGDRTSGFDTTWIRNTSEMERLLSQLRAKGGGEAVWAHSIRSNGQTHSTHFRSARNRREMST